MFFNNHNHSEYTNALLGYPDSVCKLPDLIQRAYDLGLYGISISAAKLLLFTRIRKRWDNIGSILFYEYLLIISHLNNNLIVNKELIWEW